MRSFFSNDTREASPRQNFQRDGMIRSSSPASVDTRTAAAESLEYMPGQNPDNASLILTMDDVADWINLFLLSDGDDDAKIEVTSELCQLVKTPENQRIIGSTRVIGLLAQLLDHENNDIKVNAVEALAYLAATAENRQKIVEEEAIGPLVDLLGDGHETVVQGNAAAVLTHLAKNSSFNVMIMNSGAIRLLVNLLSSRDPITIGNAAVALGQLAKTSENQDEIIGPNVVARLVCLLSYPNFINGDWVLTKAAATLGQLATKPDGKTIIVEKAAVKPLVDLLSLESSQVKMAAAEALFHLTFRHSDNQKKVANCEGAIRNLVNLLPQPNHDAQAQQEDIQTQGNALKTLRNLATNDTCHPKIVDTDAIERFVTVLSVEDRQGDLREDEQNESMDNYIMMKACALAILGELAKNPDNLQAIENAGEVTHLLVRHSRHEVDLLKSAALNALHSFADTDEGMSAIQNDPEAIPALESIMIDHSEVERRDIAWQLLDRLESTSDLNQRERVQQKATQRLIDYFKGKGVDLEQEPLQSLPNALYNDKAIFGVLIRPEWVALLLVDNPKIQSVAVLALQHLLGENLDNQPMIEVDQEAISVLSDLLLNQILVVRGSAAVVLGKLITSAQNLEKMANTKNISDWVKLLSDKNEFVKRCALMALAYMVAHCEPDDAISDIKQAIPQLIDLLSNANKLVKSYAAEVLGKLAIHQANNSTNQDVIDELNEIEPLLKLLSSEEGKEITNRLAKLSEALRHGDEEKVDDSVAEELKKILTAIDVTSNSEDGNTLHLSIDAQALLDDGRIEDLQALSYEQLLPQEIVDAIKLSATKNSLPINFIDPISSRHLENACVLSSGFIFSKKSVEGIINKCRQSGEEIQCPVSTRVLNPKLDNNEQLPYILLPQIDALLASFGKFPIKNEVETKTSPSEPEVGTLLVEVANFLVTLVVKLKPEYHEKFRGYLNKKLPHSEVKYNSYRMDLYNAFGRCWYVSSGEYSIELWFPSLQQAERLSKKTFKNRHLDRLLKMFARDLKLNIADTSDETLVEYDIHELEPYTSIVALGETPVNKQMLHACCRTFLQYTESIARNLDWLINDTVIEGRNGRQLNQAGLGLFSQHTGNNTTSTTTQTFIRRGNTT